MVLSAYAGLTTPNADFYTVFSDAFIMSLQHRAKDPMRDWPTIVDDLFLPWEANGPDDPTVFPLAGIGARTMRRWTPPTGRTRQTFTDAMMTIHGVGFWEYTSDFLKSWFTNQNPVHQQLVNHRITHMGSLAGQTQWLGASAFIQMLDGSAAPANFPEANFNTINPLTGVQQIGAGHVIENSGSFSTLYGSALPLHNGTFIDQTALTTLDDFYRSRPNPDGTARNASPRFVIAGQGAINAYLNTIAGDSTRMIGYGGGTNTIRPDTNLAQLWTRKYQWFFLPEYYGGKWWMGDFSDPMFPLALKMLIRGEPPFNFDAPGGPHDALNRFERRVYTGGVDMAFDYHVVNPYALVQANPT